MARKTKKKSLIEKAADAFDHALHPESSEETSEESFDESESEETIDQDQAPEVSDQVEKEPKPKEKKTGNKKVAGKYQKFEKGN